MKKTLSILLVMIMLVGIIAVGTVTASAAVKTTDAAFTDNFVTLDYIENTNGQYINTGYKAGKDVTVTMDLEITAWNHDYAGIFGSRSDNHSANSFVMCQYESNNKLRSEIGVKNYTDHAVGLNTRSSLSLSGSDKFSGTGLEIYLFGVNQDGSLETTNWGSATYRLYSCKITDGAEVKRDFVPAQRKSDNAIGLFDLQNGEFYTSAIETGFELTCTHREHIFDKHLECICGKVFSVDEYQPPANSYYSRTFSFKDADQIYFAASAIVKDIYLTDKNNNEIVYSGGPVLIEGNTVKITADADSSPRYAKPSFHIDAIAPVCKDEIKVVEPFCTQQGYNAVTINGVDYKWNFTDPPGHKFDKSGVCTVCNTPYSKLSYLENGNLAFGEKISFAGAEKIIVTANVVNCPNIHYGAHIVADVILCDKNGKESTTGIDLYEGKLSSAGIAVDGDYVYARANNSRLAYEFFPIYKENMTVSEGKTVYIYGGKSYIADSSLTGSVLSDGNLWIIIAVAVLALGGVATLFIVKKKKKPAMANCASAEDEE